ncbi:hypothetical protein B0H14DRAFT_2663635 [Mycena olivaceomarginata]|nr:hypothetical protein B0H14DRAFT_2663635 [Mycena olivaceomarginata]
MFMGTFHDGQQRLLFSSAQPIIPLPYSECLLTSAEFSNVSPVTYKDGGSLRSALKKIGKNNKRLKNSNPILLSRRDAFERVRKYWAAKTGTWCALDFEDWEKDHTVITEFGYRSIHWDNGDEVEDAGHLTVKEHEMYRNGTYVPDNRKHYQFGTTVEISKHAFKTKVSSLITALHSRGPIFLVFHDPSQDIKTLKQLEVPLHDAVFDLPEALPSKGIFIVDTAVLFAALIGEGSNKPGLKQACNHLQIETNFLHNAGNDAYYTLSALRAMASGEPLDTQREIRWPNRTGPAGTDSGVKVQFEPYEEDSDYSDQEGLMGGYNPRTGALRE